MWISEQPSEDDIRGHWDKLAISTTSFPDKYWDKFVKKKVGIVQWLTVVVVNLNIGRSEFYLEFFLEKS